MKTIVDLVKTANDTQLALRVSSEVIEAQGKLFNIQREALALQTENQQLRAEIENPAVTSSRHLASDDLLRGEPRRTDLVRRKRERPRSNAPI